MQFNYIQKSSDIKLCIKKIEVIWIHLHTKMYAKKHTNTNQAAWTYYNK